MKEILDYGAECVDVLYLGWYSTAGTCTHESKEHWVLDTQVERAKCLEESEVALIW